MPLPIRPSELTLEPMDWAALGVARLQLSAAQAAAFATRMATVETSVNAVLAAPWGESEQSRRVSIPYSALDPLLHRSKVRALGHLMVRRVGKFYPLEPVDPPSETAFEVDVHWPFAR
jgi:hypothetical protein